MNTVRSFRGGIGRRIKVKLLAVLGVAAINTDGVVSEGVQGGSEIVEWRSGVVVGSPDCFTVVGGVVAFWTSQKPNLERRSE